MTGGPGCAGREATRGAGERAERGVRRRQVGPAAQVGRARGAGGMAVERACWAGVRRVRERGERAGPWEIGLGRWRARREREEWAGERLGRAEGLGWGFGFGFLFYFFFSSIPNSNKV